MFTSNVIDGSVPRRGTLFFINSIIYFVFMNNNVVYQLLNLPLKNIMFETILVKLFQL